MKIRVQFISNSSSSSFIVYGVQVKERDIIKAGQKHINDFKEKYYEDICCIEEELLPKLDTKELQVAFFEGSTEGEILIGRFFSTIEDDETGKAFKERVEKDIELLFGEKKNCRLINEVIC